MFKKYERYGVRVVVYDGGEELHQEKWVALYQRDPTKVWKYCGCFELRKVEPFLECLAEAKVNFGF